MIAANALLITEIALGQGFQNDLMQKLSLYVFKWCSAVTVHKDIVNQVSIQVNSGGIICS